MKYKTYTAFSFLLAGAILFSGCSASGTNSQTSETEAAASVSENGESASGSDSSASESAASASGSDSSASQSKESQSSSDSGDVAAELTSSDFFTDRDLSGEADLEDAVAISLNKDSIKCNSDDVSISGSTATITKEGTYLLTGTLNDGSIIVDVDKEEKVQLVLDDVTITSEDFAAIYVAQADKVFITSLKGTTNSLTNGGTFTPIDDNNVDGVIYSKDDITLNGSGTLNISSPAGHGIVGKDDVTITGGTYDITASGTAIRANDSLAVSDGVFDLTADSDGLHAENNKDDTLGGIYIAGGTFTIDVGDDGIHATSFLTIEDGTFTITAAEGLEATYVTINDGDISIDASDDGINAGKKSSLYSTPTIEVNGGNITVVMGSGDTDGFDANGDIIINGGTIDVTGSSTFDYDGSGEINGGTVISNGEQITTMPTQAMGGHGGMSGGMNGGMNGNTGGQDQQGGHGRDALSGATTDTQADSTL